MRDESAAARPLIALFLGLVGFYGFFAHGYLENTDADVTMHAARALYLRGDPGLKSAGEDTWAAERYIARETGRRFGMRGSDGDYHVWFPVGHQLLMLPCIAVGETLAGWFPEVEAAYLRRRGPVLGEFYWTRFAISFLPAVFAAGSTVMVLLICLALGCDRRQALLVAAVSTLCTQFLPAASETLSDGPGMFFLLAMAALVFRHRAGRGGALGAFAAGVCGGWAVLARYPHAAAVLVLALVVADTARRRGALRDLGALALGALPEALILLGANWLRFGDLLETGYSAGATAQWWSYPAYLGIPVMLLAPGKGVLWFSTPLWVAVPAFCGRSVRRFPFAAVLLIFALPLAMFGQTSGWAAGQCWGIRYLTPGVVLLVAVGLATARPWQRRPRVFAAVCGLGLLVSLGGVLTPYRGQQELAFQAAHAVYPGAPHLDNNVNFAPRFSPIHTHWIYAWLSATGRLGQGGAANTTGPLFGVGEVENAGLSVPEEDAGFRHWWMVFLRDHLPLPLWLVAGAWWLVTGALLGRALRRLLAS